MFNVVKWFAYWCVAAVMPSASSQSADEAKASPESQARRIDAFQGKPRVFFLSYIGNEADDQMPLTRILLYSKEFDVEGLVATTSTWQKGKVSPEIMQKVISNYGKMRSNLLKDADGFPTADDLLNVVKAGQPAYGMAAVGKDKMSPGAELLIKAVDRKDRRPLFATIWGGAKYTCRGTIAATREPLVRRSQSFRV